MPHIADSSYKPPFICRNAHVQTTGPTLLRKVKGVTYERERIETDDGDFIDLDWSRPGSRRAVLVLHGLEGNSDRAYARGMVRAINRREWDAVVMNFRGCSGEPNRLLRSYHAADTHDLDQVIRHVLNSPNYDEVNLVGFSLGGNVILKYLGERGKDVPDRLTAAATFSVPCMMLACSRALEKPSNKMYTKRFLKMLHEKIREKMHVMPDRIDDEGYERIKTCYEFDERYTAPIHGFANAEDYYRQASCKPYLPFVTIPTLIVNALDDPFLDETCYPVMEARTNPNLFLETPARGGHVGFISFNKKGEFWSESRACDFLAAHG